MSRSLSGRTALVTGGARRVGRAIALGLADAGADVVVHFQTSAEEAEETARAARGRGVRAWTVGADLSVAAEAEQLVEQAVERAGGVDFLINNASIFRPGTVAELSPATLAENVQINAYAPFQLARSLARQGRGGRVVNLLDTRVAAPVDPAYVGYGLSKALLHELTGLLALELAPDVTVNAVAPGAILPPAGAEPDRFERLGDRLPLGRTGDPADVVRAVLFFVQSGFVTGQVIYVDGGQHLKGRQDG
ncbi:MAG: SDR family oxidoreductase [bacterium]